MPLRVIEDILHFREDISPFLVHLTRSRETISADNRLRSIIEERHLTCSKEKISDIRYAFPLPEVERYGGVGFLSAISFTETPLNEIHCLLEIQGRKVNLEPYGLVFLKDRLVMKGVSPVLYLNNKLGDKDSVLGALASLADSHREEALEILPLIATYGQRVKGVGATINLPGRKEFMWEREWRRPYIKGNLEFTEEDVFVGLCPHDEIDNFESLWPEIPFVDPRRNMKWYAKKLIDSRQRLDIKDSVV